MIYLSLGNGDNVNEAMKYLNSTMQKAGLVSNPHNRSKWGTYYIPTLYEILLKQNDRNLNSGKILDSTYTKQN